ncbi:zinc finger CCCH domain-containing protein 13-like [Neodiprion virginianus]|uniref:zinc finger CCCH domain-containing protein 13-like n=1 Tax=Neodiprion virginianus TaxID=2961670 RepID=UPI001EE6C5E2|nr:zinc finger CCCH domain-containing protein 13-like [Neodiprion virginianus]XP_046622842.1 zinc finger CCCH domain-containing protein 13-like [Neodiprion virginianus]
MREKIRVLLLIYGLLLTAVWTTALKPTRPKFKIATSSTTTTTEEPEPEEPVATTVQTDVNATTGHTLTGIPQIDYIWDPNLPRELNGYNLSSYPFYSTVPTEEIDFKCDGLHDGFYASIQHKCQVYHHCLFGTRYDFLCANFTAFDQKTFICHFASEVDCANSKKYWHRNDALYQAATTTTTSTTTTTTIAPPVPAAPQVPVGRPLLRDPTRRRRPWRRRPAYDYVYDDDYYDEAYERTRGRGYDRRDGYQYDDRDYVSDRDRDRDYRDPERDRSIRHRERERDRDNPAGYGPRDASDRRPVYDDRDQRDREKIPASRPNRREPPIRARPVDQYDEDTRPLPRDRARDPETTSYPDGRGAAAEDRRKETTDVRTRDSSRDSDDRRTYNADKRYRNDYDDKSDPAPVATGGTDGLVKPAAPSSSVYARPRAPPKIRRPVPVSEKNKYAYNVSAAPAAAPVPNDETRRRPDPVDDDYVDDDLEETRPRRPGRRRPAYRDKETYDSRETRDRERERDRDRDRDRERTYRPRYQDEEEEEGDEVSIRKRPDRQRDRHYERGDRPYGYERDRTVGDRGSISPSTTERPAAQYPIRSERPIVPLSNRPSNRDDDYIRPKFSAREREPPIVQSEPVKKPNFYSQRMEKTIDTSQQTFINQERDDGESVVQDEEDEELEPPTRNKNYRDKTNDQSYPSPDPEPKLASEEPSARPPLIELRGNYKYEEASSESPLAIDYSSGTLSEYYDEPEEVPVSSPRTTLRVVKRPFLPSRGGNPNPRGLKQVGLRVEPRSDEIKSSSRQTSDFDSAQNQPISREHSSSSGARSSRLNTGDETIFGTTGDRDYSPRRQPYDAYRTIQSDVRQRQGEDLPIEAGIATRPQSRRLQKDDSITDEKDSPRSQDEEEFAHRQFDQRFPASRNDGEQFNAPPRQDSSVTLQSRNPDDVENQLQDIPESEYDVALNDALPPTLNKESNLPSGFVLPLHRQLERDTNLQSSQRNYLLTRPAEPVVQVKSSSSQGSSSYPVPPSIARARATFPRPPPGAVFAPGHPQAPWQGYDEY